MAKLKEYLGALIGDINHARVLADLESAKIAQIYAQNELLKHFSIPRFRAQDIELDIPIAIDGFETQGKKDFEPIDNRSFNSATYNTFKDVAKVDAFSRITARIINNKISNNTKSLESKIKARYEFKEVFMEFLNQSREAFYLAVEKDNIKLKNIKESQRNLELMLRKNLMPQIKTRHENQDIENTNVIVEAAKLREIPDKNIIKIKIKLFEDGMEWHSTKNEQGENLNKLLPE